MYQFNLAQFVLEAKMASVLTVDNLGYHIHSDTEHGASCIEVAEIPCSLVAVQHRHIRQAVR